MNKRILIYLFVALAAIAAITGVVMLSNPFVEDSSKATMPGVVEPTQEPAATQKPAATQEPSSQTTAKPVETEPPEPLSVAFDSEVDQCEWGIYSVLKENAMLAKISLTPNRTYLVSMIMDLEALRAAEMYPFIGFNEPLGTSIFYHESPELFEVYDRPDGTTEYIFEITTDSSDTFFLSAYAGNQSSVEFYDPTTQVKIYILYK